MRGGLCLTLTLHSTHFISSFHTTRQLIQSKRLPYSINGLLLPEDVIRTGEPKHIISLFFSPHICVYARTAVNVCESSGACLHSQTLISYLITLEKIAVTCGVALTETRCILLPPVIELCFLSASVKEQPPGVLMSHPWMKKKSAGKYFHFFYTFEVLGEAVIGLNESWTPCVSCRFSPRAVRLWGGLIIIPFLSFQAGMWSF